MEEELRDVYPPPPPPTQADDDVPPPDSRRDDFDDGKAATPSAPPLLLAFAAPLVLVPPRPAFALAVRDTSADDTAAPDAAGFPCNAFHCRVPILINSNSITSSVTAFRNLTRSGWDISRVSTL